MLRTLSLIAVILAALLWAYPSEACSETCQCQKAAQEKAATPATPATPTVTQKCSCSSAADCTCKKGQCKCKACGGVQQQMVPSPSPAPQKS